MSEIYSEEGTPEAFVGADPRSAPRTPPRTTGLEMDGGGELELASSQNILFPDAHLGIVLQLAGENILVVANSRD